MTIRVDWRGLESPITFGVYRNSPEPFFLAPKAVEQSAFIEMPDAQTLVDYGMYPYWNNYRALDDPWMYI